MWNICIHFLSFSGDIEALQSDVFDKAESQDVNSLTTDFNQLTTTVNSLKDDVSQIKIDAASVIPQNSGGNLASDVER